MLLNTIQCKVHVPVWDVSSIRHFRTSNLVESRAKEATEATRGSKSVFDWQFESEQKDLHGCTSVFLYICGTSVYKFHCCKFALDQITLMMEESHSRDPVLTQICMFAQPNMLSRCLNLSKPTLVSKSFSEIQTYTCSFVDF